MNLFFHIEYNTTFGEEISLNLCNENKDRKVEESKYKMYTIDGKSWYYHLNLDITDPKTVLEYYYSLDNNGYESRREWITLMHKVELNASQGTNYNIYDHWSDIPEQSYLYSYAFTDCVTHHRCISKGKNYAKTLRLVVRAPQLGNNEKLVLIGNCKALGDWDTKRALSMCIHNINEWVIDIDANKLNTDILEFKFVAYNEIEGTTLWESGENRQLMVPKQEPGDVAVYSLAQASFPKPNSRLAGTLIPVFSLRSKTSFGVGDFGDLKLMVDFIAASGQRLLQVLPINDTTITHTWTDSYPYSCISIFALHPQFVDLRQLPELKDEETAKHFESLRQKLNDLPQIDYEEVNNAKIEYLKLLFEQKGKQMLANASFKKFFKENELWLVPYAQYCYLRDTNGTADFTKWEGHTTWNEDDREKLSNSQSNDYKQVSFYYFVQYLLDMQMSAVHEYARSKCVILKGDIPIGVNRYGCDVWMEPKYFNLDGQAGAPPDNFSANGQNWGFPTYNWDEMLRDNCAWWVRRFQNMSKYFDAYRIDHVLGFFRIWDIPVDAVHGLLGQFSPSLGLNREEIERYGLLFQEDLFTKPFISDWVIDRTFKENANEVKEKYLNHLHNDIYELKPEYSTQRKVEAAFTDMNSEKDIWIRDGLYSLISNVLFVRDKKDNSKFHPRISAQYNFIYEILSDSAKAAFNRLYNDYYYHRNNDFWYHEAMRKLPKLVQATRMLACAEDLGMVPDCVAWVMNELKILSLELESMPKDPNVRFGNVSRNPYGSVCTISSHDTPTLRQWWDENYERTQDYYNSILHHAYAAPHPLPGLLASEIIGNHLKSPSMLCVISIQDWFAVDENLRLSDANAERINIPANPKHYWRYRMHVAIEDLISNVDFCGTLSHMISESGRK